jgi:hypothetical protein
LSLAALQAGTGRWFQLRAVAPISGDYDLRHELPALLNAELNAQAAVIYTEYLLVAWNRLHHLYDSPAEVSQAPRAAPRSLRRRNSRATVS